MDKVAALPAAQREELFSETAARKGMTPAIVEKDFWVCWTLSKLFSHADLSRLLMFKGGTSLSKVFNLIERFSEDIDLILDWWVVAGEDPLEERTKTQQDKFNKAINVQAQGYIAGELVAMVSSVIVPVCSCSVDSADGHVINVRYPAAFSDEYLRPEVRLEIGSLASWFPFDHYQIKPYAAEAFPDVFSDPECAVIAIKAVRTFWEKATILHQEAHRSVGSDQLSRHSRHYYDLAMMAKSEVKGDAIVDLPQLEAVVEFKKKFYPCNWAQYDMAKPGTLKLIPEAHVLAVVRKDYADMRNMIFGTYPDFDEILATLQSLEDEINALG